MEGGALYFSAVFGSLGEPLDRVLNEMWRGPADGGEWIFDPYNPSSRIRTWPVRFESRERFKEFVNAFCASPEGAYNAVLRAAASQAEYDDVEVFLDSKMPSELRTIYVSAKDQDTGVVVRSISLNTTGSDYVANRKAVKVFVSHPYKYQEEISAPLEEGFQIEELLDFYAAPMSRIALALGKPIVPSISSRVREQRRYEQRSAWIAAVVSLVVSIGVAVVSGMLGN